MEIVFLGLLFFIALIGISSSRFNKPTVKNYYLADKSLSPWLSGLSAMATNNSGYMFIGLIGFTYLNGLSSIWLMIGWILGDYLITKKLFPKIITKSFTSKNVTYASIIGSLVKNKLITKLIAIISFVFLLIYASAQFAASGKTLMAVMNWEFYFGVITGGLIVLVYSLTSGIRASIWTDAAQSIIMFVSMGALVIFSIIELGGVNQALFQLSEIDGFMSPFQSDHTDSIVFNIFSSLSWIVAGMFVVGQPHIMIRFFAVKNNSDLVQSRAFYYSSYILFYGLAFTVGMLSRLVLDQNIGFDPELALPMMAQILFNPFMVGLIISGIFAATMSTADSLIINCSGNISQDILELTKFSKMKITSITLIVALTSIMIALINSGSVFSIVVFSWTILGFLLTPLLIMISLNKSISTKNFVISALLSTTVFYVVNQYTSFDGVYLGIFPFFVSLIYLYLVEKK
ncbi:MAG: sodium/proline symporter [Betaproteobacteria bacterium]|nr:sodium/proline symporter [Betaproteobacteria bacterium]